MYGITSIERIGIKKVNGSEWSDFTKKFSLIDIPEKAIMRLSSQGVCAAFINGTFVEAIPGRYPGRVAAFNISQYLKKGENEIRLHLGSSYFQEMGFMQRTARNAWFSWCALSVHDGNDLLVSTDSSWNCESDDGQTKPVCLSAVGEEEFNDVWRSAAVWEYECKPYPEKIESLVGRNTVKKPTVLEPKLIEAREDANIYDFGKTVVGYFEIEYEAEADGSVTLKSEYTESAADLDQPREWWGSTWLRRLEVKTDVSKGHSSFLIYRRRAGHYYKISFTEGIKIKSVKLHTSMMPQTEQGMFESNDELLNKIWSVGAYTLEINRHHEYESCPRKEMLYFAGDGAIDVLTEFYTFGKTQLAEASLSMCEVVGDNGKVDGIHSRGKGLWDYPGWRILTVWLYYFYTGDREFVKKFYNDVVESLEWFIDKRGADNLVYQFPTIGDQFFLVDGCVDYTGGNLRLGEKPYLNALFYNSLVAMSELAKIMDDPRGKAWLEISEKVKKSFNEKLWSDEKKAFVNTYDDSYISLDDNVLALLYGICDKDRIDTVLDTIEKRLHGEGGSTVIDKESNDSRCSNNVISPMFNTFEAQARFELGDAVGAMEVIKSCWGTMVEKGAETFWEYAPNDKTTKWNIPAHAWSSGVSFVISAYILGIRPKTVGYKTLLFAPNPVVDEFKGVVPTVKGYVAATLKTENGIHKYVLCIPKGLKYECKLSVTDEIQVIEY